MKGKYRGNFGLNILILTKINCITLKIRSKADFKSKLQNIWQQIILFSSTVMQMVCVWHKIWTLSGRLSFMRNVQLMENIYIFRVYHIRIIAKKKLVHTNETDRFLNNHCQECVRAYLMIVYLFFTRSWSAIIGPKLFFTRSWSAIIVENIFWLETCMNRLVKVPPYSKLNFQGQIFFTQNWCNITLKM